MAGDCQATGRWGAVVWGALALAVLLIAAYAFSLDLRASRGAAITGDEPFYLLTTQSLVRDGDLDLRQQYARESYREFFDHPEGLWRQSAPAPGGRLLAPHDPGLPLLLVPGFVLGGVRGAQAELLVLAALAFGLAYVLAARLAGGGWHAWLATLAVALAATPFVYSTEIYPEVPAALGLVLALLAAGGGGRPGTARAAFLALALTGVVWLGVKYAPLAAIVGGWFLLRAGARGRVTLAGLGAVAAATFVWWHLDTFGALTPYSVNVVYQGQSTFELLGSHLGLVNRAYRLWGLFIDERFGIGRWAPVLLAALPGLVLLGRRGAASRVVVLLVAVQVGIGTFVAITMMGWWFPGRTLMAVLPLFAVALAAVAGRGGALVRSAVVPLGLYSVSVTAALAHAGHVGQVTVAVDPFDMGAPWFQGLRCLFPNYTSWDAATWGPTVAWLGAVAVIGAWVGWRRRRPGSRRGRPEAFLRQ